MNVPDCHFWFLKLPNLSSPFLLEQPAGALQCMGTHCVLATGIP